MRVVARLGENGLPEAVVVARFVRRARSHRCLWVSRPDDLLGRTHSEASQFSAVPGLVDVPLGPAMREFRICNCSPTRRWSLTHSWRRRRSPSSRPDGAGRPNAPGRSHREHDRRDMPRTLRSQSSVRDDGGAEAPEHLCSARFRSTSRSVSPLTSASRRWCMPPMGGRQGELIHHSDAGSHLSATDRAPRTRGDPTLDRNVAGLRARHGLRLEGVVHFGSQLRSKPGSSTELPPHLEVAAVHPPSNAADGSA